jgi:hypothetical protein
MLMWFVIILIICVLACEGCKSIKKPKTSAYVGTMY